MSATPCPRLFEAGAMRDGRLTGAERASFSDTSPVHGVSREVQALEDLAESLRASPPDPAAVDELHVRRERTRLLAAFDGALLAPRRSWGVGHRLLGSAAVAPLVIAILVLPRMRRPAEAPGHASSAVVHADTTAVWTERMVGERENVVLERGALWIDVDHSSGEGRLLVVLPDGEMEDIGTTFMVSAEDGRTTRVAVEEGHVVLRLRGQAPIALGPGDASIPDPRPVASARASFAPSADLAPPARLDCGERSTPSLGHRHRGLPLLRPMRRSISGPRWPRSTSVTITRPPRRSRTSSRSILVIRDRKMRRTCASLRSRGLGTAPP